MKYRGKNAEKSTLELYNERRKYDTFILTEGPEPQPGVTETKKIKDFLFAEKLFFGRIDPRNNSIILKQEKLKSIKGDIMALNFVADAFGDLSTRFMAAANSGQVQGKHSIYSSFSAKKAYVSPIKQFKTFADSLIGSFLPFADLKGRKDDIKDFATFFPVFKEFLLRKARHGIPITRSFFIKSDRVTPLCSGLMIEIHNGDYGDDAIKSSLFHKQRDFAYLKNIAYQHGFVIDKNIPWRLVADVYSPNMAPYIKRRMSASNDAVGSSFFSEFYDRATENDFVVMIKLATAVYNRFVGRYPVIEDRECSTAEVSFRQRISFEEVWNSTKSHQWLDLYTRVRAAETQVNYEEPTIDRIVGNAIDLANSIDITSGMSYINSKFDNVEHFEGSFFHEFLREKLARNPKEDSEDILGTTKRSVQESNFKTY
mgnify:CR=1 FL=1|tara:strand:+ start:3050 stop:4330 length:1281 start_codon:yes stop_codon:yes gene_type:complete